MKKQILVITISLLFLFSVGACKKKETQPVPKTSGPMMPGQMPPTQMPPTQMPPNADQMPPSDKCHQRKCHRWGNNKVCDPV